MDTSDTVVFRTKHLDLSRVTNKNNDGPAPALPTRKRGRPSAASKVPDVSDKPPSESAPVDEEAMFPTEKCADPTVGPKIVSTTEALAGHKAGESMLPPSSALPAPRAANNGAASAPAPKKRVRIAAASRKSRAAPREEEGDEDEEEEAARMEILRLQMNVVGYYQLLPAKIASYGFTSMPAGLFKWDKTQLEDHLRKIRTCMNLATNSGMMDAAAMMLVGAIERGSIWAHHTYKTTPLIGLSTNVAADKELRELMTEVMLEDLALYTVSAKARLLFRCGQHVVGTYEKNREILRAHGINPDSAAASAPAARTTAEALNREAPDSSRFSADAYTPPEPQQQQHRYVVVDLDDQRNLTIPAVIPTPELDIKNVATTTLRMHTEQELKDQKEHDDEEERDQPSHVVKRAKHV